MSYKTNIRTKISSIPRDSGDGGKEKKSQSSGTSNTAKDSYTTEQPVSGGYQMILAGNRNHPRYDDQIQSILNGMGSFTPMSAGRSYTPEEEAIMHVPDLERDILKDPERHNNVKPVLERYISLEKMLMAQLAEIEKDLKSGRGTTEEKAILWKKKGNYEEKLFECRKQLDKTRLYYQWEKKNKAEAAKKT